MALVSVGLDQKPLISSDMKSIGIHVIRISYLVNGVKSVSVKSIFFVIFI